MENNFTIESERLILRPFMIKDLEAFYQLMKDEEVNRFLPVMPFNGVEDAEVFLKKNYITADPKEIKFAYAICLKADNIPIGYIKISEYPSYDLGYGLGKEYWHKGFVTEACEALLEHVKKSDIPYITATHDVNNARSGHVMKKSE